MLCPRLSTGGDEELRIEAPAPVVRRPVVPDLFVVMIQPFTSSRCSPTTASMQLLNTIYLATTVPLPEAVVVVGILGVWR